MKKNYTANFGLIKIADDMDDVIDDACVLA